MTTESKSQLGRRAKAEALVASGRVRPVYGRPGEYAVEGSGAAVYLVGASCVCPDSTNRHDLRGQCKHQLAVTIYAEQQTAVNRSKTAWTEEDEVKLKELF